MAESIPNTQNEAAANSPANSGVKHGVTETDGEGNFTGAGSTTPKANDPLVNRDAVAPEIQDEKPETNQPRSGSEMVDPPTSGQLGDRDMAVVAPYHPDEDDSVNENYRRAKEDSLKNDPVAEANRARKTDSK